LNQLFKSKKLLDKKPHKVFAHQTLQSWLGRMLWTSWFEDLIDLPLAWPPWSPGDEMHNMWDGSVWNAFEDPYCSGSLYT
jgi:hypothetical protein